jgi:hypothetical protein
MAKNQVILEELDGDGEFDVKITNDGGFDAPIHSKADDLMAAIAKLLGQPEVKKSAKPVHTHSHQHGTHKHKH